MSMPSVLIRNRILLILVLPVFFFSCSVAKNYKTLSFFFDGVPDPNQKKAAAEQSAAKKGSQSKRIRPVIVIKSGHPDYAKKRCSKCHDNTKQSYLKTSRDKLCFTCHKAEKFTGKFLHGPVAVKHCHTCHLPHNSRYPRLLVKIKRPLCLQCHKEEEINIIRDHTTRQYDDCVRCHLPHAADNKFFLKPSVQEKN